jgi:hypothetical protein
MNETSIVATNVEQKKLIITRQLGFKDLIPGCGQWQVLTKMRDECWVAGQHILTIFLWSFRIGNTSEEKDDAKLKYYHDKVKSMDDDIKEFGGDVVVYETPHIGGAFNNWVWKEMRNLVDFCLEMDPDPPNFIALMIEEGDLPEKCGEPYNEELTEA